MLTLKPIGPSSASAALDIVHAAFAPLLAVYQDHATSPANKPLERFEQALARENTDGYLILLSDTPVGYVRVDRLAQDVYSLADLCILPAWQNRGFAQQAVRQLEARYPHARVWCLVTIAQEARDCHLYEKLGYVCLGETQRPNERMTLVYYFKSMLPGVQIRPLRESDFDATHAMYAQVHALHAAKRPDIYAQTDFFDRALFDELLSSTSGVTLAAETNGRAVGLCALQWRASSPLPLLQRRTYAFIDDLCVDEAFRRRGIGRLLMSAATLYARGRGLKSVELNVWSFNESAIRFYESLGMTCQRLQMEWRL